MLSLPATGVKEVLTCIFAAAGGSQDEALRIAENLTEASLMGHDSHGIVRTQRYVEWAQSDAVRFGQSTETVTDGGVFALLDGCFGFGQSVGREAVERGIGIAREHGVGVLALRNAGHLGRIGAWAEMACDAGLASIHFVNVQNSLLVAPFGGAGRRMSTAPVCVGVPEAEGGNFILDFATSKIAEGKALVAFKGRTTTPPATLIDGDGLPSDDPRSLYGDINPDRVADPRRGRGALAPMGDHKGSGLALACELLAGALTGSGTGGRGSKIHNGMLSIYLDPARMGDTAGWAEAAREYLAFVRSCPAAKGTERVMTPGEPERARMAERLREGLPVTVGVWDSILAAADSVGLKRAAMSDLVKGEPT